MDGGRAKQGPNLLGKAGRQRRNPGEGQCSNPNGAGGFPVVCLPDADPLEKRAQALRDGELASVETGNPAIVSFKRQSAEQTVLVLHNLSGQTQEVSLETMRPVGFQGSHSEQQQCGRHEQKYRFAPSLFHRYFALNPSVNRRKPAIIGDTGGF